MISKILLLRNVGKFDSVSDGASLPLAKLAIIYGENGRGKTTLSAILRSLANNDPLPITERRRFSSQNTPHVVLESDDGDVIFENGAWNGKLPDIEVFDDSFVDENIYSGLAIETEHRQNLHEWILGAPGVKLNQRLQELVARIEIHNSNLRDKTALIPEKERHGLTVEQFCALTNRPEIDDELLAAERNLAAAEKQESVRTASIFDEIRLPGIDLESIEAVLNSDLASLDSASMARVQSHFGYLGNGGEAWVGEGMGFMPEITKNTGSNLCPFCAQDMAGSPLIDHYRNYFSEEYVKLKLAISESLQQFNRDHVGEVTAAFERTVRVTGERREFWAEFGDIPPFAVDTALIAQDWNSARDAIVTLITEKQATPLERIKIPEEARSAVSRYEGWRQSIAVQNTALQQANTGIPLVKEQAAGGDPAVIAAELERLRAVKARHDPAISALCTDYIVEDNLKAQTEIQRNTTREELEKYRDSVFPGFETAINGYLHKFNAGFRVAQLTPRNTRGGSTCTYNVIINNTPVPVAGGEAPLGEPAFRNTLSSGDRNTLALAFFFSSLDKDPELANKLVVIDDPFTSLDENRSLTTVQEMRRLAQKSAQVIILSHSKPFLCRIWEGTDTTLRSALQLIRNGEDSTLQAWDVNQDCITEHDRRHDLLNEYQSSGTPDSREVAQAIRPMMEAYLRVATPKIFPPGQLLGPFRDLCQQRIGTADEILSASKTQELQDLKEYANKFHHDTNAAWETEAINDGELRGFVDRVLRFTGPS